jgi:hypothetical protein
MSDTAKASREQYLEQMKEEMEAYLSSVIEAVNNAPDGAWIAGSEEQVREVSAEFRRRMFEKAVQMRVDAAEAAFPPPPLNASTGKRLANKGRQDKSVLTVNCRPRAKARTKLGKSSRSSTSTTRTCGISRWP